MYKITKTGYGQYYVSNGHETFYTTESRMIDALDDEEDPMHDEAVEWAERHCDAVRESTEEYYNQNS